jgi:hypothetical protein
LSLACNPGPMPPVKIQRELQCSSSFMDSKA